MLNRDQFADRTAERMSIRVRKADIGTFVGVPQVAHEAVAYDKQYGHPIAHVQIAPAAEMVVGSEDDPWVQHAFTDRATGQRRMPIESMPAHVSHAMASREGQATGAAHVALSALAEHFNEKPFADSSLTEHGARMARSAARRGLIRGHPDNPEMEATIPAGWFVEPGSQQLDSDLHSIDRAFFQQDRMHSVGYGTATPVTELSHQEVKRAAQRLARPRQEVQQPQGEQLSIQFG